MLMHKSRAWLSKLMIPLIMLQTLLLTSVASANSVTVCLGASATRAKPGDQVVVPVHLGGSVELGGATVELRFDPQRLEVSSVTNGRMFMNPADNGGGSLSLGSFNNSAGTVERTIFRTNKLGVYDGSGPLYEVRFRVKSNAPQGSASVSVASVTGLTRLKNGVDLFDRDSKWLAASVSPGSVTIQVVASSSDPAPATCSVSVPNASPPPPPPTGGTGSDTGGLTTDTGGLTTDTGGLSTDTGGLSTDTGGVSTGTGGTGGTGTGGTGGSAGTGSGGGIPLPPPPPATGGAPLPPGTISPPTTGTPPDTGQSGGGETPGTPTEEPVNPLPTPGTGVSPTPGSPGQETPITPQPAEPPASRAQVEAPGSSLPAALTVKAEAGFAAPPAVQAVTGLRAEQVVQTAMTAVGARAPGAETAVVVRPFEVRGNIGIPVVAQVELPPGAAAAPELALVVRLKPDGSVVPVRTRWDAESNTLRFSAAQDGTYTVLQVKRAFADVQQHWAQEAITVMASRLVAGGYPDGGFKPEQPVTRAEFVTFLVRALALEPVEGGSASFADVSDADWYASSVRTAAALGLVSGVGEGLFGANQQITREQVAVLLSRALRASGRQLAVASAEAVAAFADSDQISSWARADLAAIVQLGLLRGVDGSTLAPKGIATRAQTMALLTRLLNQLD